MTSGGLEEKILYRRSCVRRAVDEEASIRLPHPDADERAWLDGLCAFIEFHLPRLSLDYALRLARGGVQEAAQRVAQGGRIGAPPRVSEAVRAFWEGSGGIWTEDERRDNG